MEELMQKAEEQEKIIEELRARVRHLALEHATLNRLDPVNSVATLADYFECTFYSDFLVLVVIHAEAEPMRRHNAQEVYSLMKDVPIGAQKETVYYPIESMQISERIFRQVFEPQNHGLTFRVGQDIGILINPDEQYISHHRLEHGNYYSELLLQMEVFLRQLDAELGFRSIAVVSRLYQGRASLRQMYIETRDTFDYSWNLTGNVHAYPDVFSSVETAKENHSINALELEFLNDINRKLFFEASVVLDNILQRQLKRAMPLDEIKISVVARLRNVLAVMDASSQVMPRDEEAAFDLVTRVSESVSIPELHDRIHDFFTFLSDNMPGEIVKKSALIMDFIESNYQNQNLSAQIICDRFRISPTYLSRIVKADLGKGLPECIHEVRVRNAKGLLESTDLGIEQVAVQVGFSNRYGLIRAFRAVEGMTPTEYRSRFRGEQE